MHSDGLSEAIETQNVDGRGGMTRLATKLGLTRAAVSAWRRGITIPAERAIKIEQITGVPRHRLRPDLWPDPDDPTADAAE